MIFNLNLPCIYNKDDYGFFLSQSSSLEVLRRLADFETNEIAKKFNFKNIKKQPHQQELDFHFLEMEIKKKIKNNNSSKRK